MEELILAAGVEGVKFLASYYIQQQRLAGMTDEQIGIQFKADLEEFKKNDPSLIPEVTP